MCNNNNNNSSLHLIYPFNVFHKLNNTLQALVNGQPHKILILSINVRSRSYHRVAPELPMKSAWTEDRLVCRHQMRDRSRRQTRNNELRQAKWLRSISSHQTQAYVPLSKILLRPLGPQPIAWDHYLTHSALRSSAKKSPWMFTNGQRLANREKYIIRILWLAFRGCDFLSLIQ